MIQLMEDKKFGKTMKMIFDYSMTKKLKNKVSYSKIQNDKKYFLYLDRF